MPSAQWRHKKPACLRMEGELAQLPLWRRGAVPAGRPRGRGRPRRRWVLSCMDAWGAEAAGDHSAATPASCTGQCSCRPCTQWSSHSAHTQQSKNPRRTSSSERLAGVPALKGCAAGAPTVLVPKSWPLLRQRANLPHKKRGSTGCACRRSARRTLPAGCRRATRGCGPASHTGGGQNTRTGRHKGVAARATTKDGTPVPAAPLALPLPAAAAAAGPGTPA